MNEEYEAFVDFITAYRDDVFDLAGEMLERAQTVVEATSPSLRPEAQRLYQQMQQTMLASVAVLVQTQRAKFRLPPP